LESKSPKLIILALLELLAKETDEDHPISAEELCCRLKGQGFSCTRKTLYRDIAALKSYGSDILYTRFPRAGYFLAQRMFEIPEIRLLMDAVCAAPFITERKTEELVGKLAGLLSRGQAEEAGSRIYVQNCEKIGNEEIYYTIDTAARAITQKKKIQFTYYHRVISENRAVPDAGRSFLISPYALIWNSDRYYLAGNYGKYDSVSVYRLDRMKHTCISDESSRPFEEVSEYRGRFNTEDFARRTFHMYHGERRTVELRCSSGLLEAVLDKFGNDIPLNRQDENTFTIQTEIYLSEGFVEWVLQYGGQIEVLSPEPLRQEIVRRIRAMENTYRLTEKTYGR